MIVSKRNKITIPGARLILLVLLFIFTGVQQAAAHPMGNFAVCHYSAIRAHKDAIRIHYIIDIAEVPAYRILRGSNVDENADGAYSEAEGRGLLDELLPDLLAGLHLDVNGDPVAMKVLDSSVEVRDGLPGLKTIWLELELEAPLEFDALAGREVFFRDKNYPDSGGWKEIRVYGTEDTRIIESTPLSELSSNALTEYQENLGKKTPDDLEVRFTYGPGRSEELYQASAGEGAGGQSLLQKVIHKLDVFRFLEEKELGFGIVVMALAFAFVGGGLHAVQPGHGKTLVAAYLVGTRGRPSDAVLLGVIVTLTHVAAVVVLFVVLITFWNRLNPESVFPWLGVGSGVIIMLMGIWIIFRNFRGTYIPQLNPEREHEHSHESGHANPHHEHDHDRGHSHSHDESQYHDHNEHMAHPEVHSHHGHTHTHGPGHGHTHVPDLKNVRLADLLTLGITGGIIPCPTAVMILFAAVGLNRLVFGLALTVSFSIGMAVVLIAIGLFVVQARSFAGSQIANSKLPRILPYLSGAFVFLIGLGILLNGLRSAGLL